MTKRVGFIKKIIIVMLAGIMSVFILSTFTFIYNYSGIHITNATSATDYKWQSGQWKSTMTEGFSWFHMDKNGFNNCGSIPDNVDILLMGSSHMEAVEVASDENTGYLLNQLAPDYDTYNIGISGHQIYNCVNNLKDAVEEYLPTQYVILETDTVKLNTDKMLAVLDGEYPHIPSYDSGMLYLLQRYVPAMKNIYNAVDEWRAVGSKATEPDDENAAYEITADDSSFENGYSDTLNAFLEKASNDSGNKLVIFYQPKTSIDEKGSFADNGDMEYRELFADACETNGIKFIDMTDDFKNLYETNHILAHGFSNTAVGVGHLNKYGHRVIAERLVKELEIAEE